MSLLALLCIFAGLFLVALVATLLYLPESRPSNPDQEESTWAEFNEEREARRQRAEARENLIRLPGKVNVGVDRPKHRRAA